MARVARTCLRSILKIVNSTLGLVGIAMILYGFWMLRVLQRDMESPSFDDFDSTALWFIYAFLSIGVALCLITCLGHISADSSNGICLSCYMVIIFLLLLLETLVAADILLNSDWEKVHCSLNFLLLPIFHDQHPTYFSAYTWSCSIRIYLRIRQGGSMISESLWNLILTSSNG